MWKIINCKECGNKIKNYWWRPNQKFCSNTCYRKWRKENEYHYKTRIPIYKGGYRLLFSPNHPNRNNKGYVYEHRLVMEKSIGRFLTKDEIVHHKDENRLNNVSSNLQLTTKGNHLNHHRTNASQKRKRGDDGRFQKNA